MNRPLIWGVFELVIDIFNYSNIFLLLIELTNEFASLSLNTLFLLLLSLYLLDIRGSSKTINKYSLEYLNKSILVDFGKKNMEKKDISAGYVDLSENGDINEALFNLYDVLHQLNNVNKSNILFMDLYNSQDELYKTMSDKLTRCCNNQRIMIPVHYD